MRFALGVAVGASAVIAYWRYGGSWWYYVSHRGDHGPNCGCHSHPSLAVI